MRRTSASMGSVVVVALVAAGAFAGGVLFLPTVGPMIASWGTASNVPSMINHQGVVTVSGLRFNGSGQFKFAIIDPDTGANVWTNDGSGVGTSGVPTNAVSLTVTDGVYNVALGNTSLTNMTAVASNLFADGNLVLRIWFNDGTNGFQQLSPDHTLTSTAYAMTVADGSVTAVKLASNAVTTAKITDGAVAAVKLGSDVGLVPVGTVVATAASSAPAGWLVCDGANVSRTTYAALFAAVGTAYGAGDGSTTFSLPDLRGRVPMGTGTGAGGGASGAGKPTGGSALTARNRGDWTGEEKHTLTVSEMPAHNHGVYLEFGTSAVNSGAGTNYSQVQGSGGYYGPFSAPISSTGGGGAHNVIQPVTVLSFIIKY